MIYINYKTKLIKPVKDSVNPTNKVELKAESDGAISHSYVQLVGGKGDASGENKPEPTFEIPHDAPKVEIPEWNGGVTPPDAPKYDKPEFNGGVVPNEAPILDLPELHIPEEPTPEKPSTPKEAPSKPVDAPKAKEVEITEVVYKNDSEPKEAVNTAVYGGVSA